MKKMTRGITAAIAGAALALVGAGVGTAVAEPEDLVQGLDEQQELTGEYDRDTSDDWFYDSYTIEEQQQFQAQQEPFTADEPMEFELEEELQELEQEIMPWEEQELEQPEYEPQTFQEQQYPEQRFGEDDDLLDL